MSNTMRDELGKRAVTAQLICGDHAPLHEPLVVTDAMNTDLAKLSAAATQELLPCPFCGSASVDPKGWLSEETAGPACDDCGASAGSALLPLEENITQWNTRNQLVERGAGVGEAIKAVANLEMEREGHPPSRTVEEVYADAAETVEAALAALGGDDHD